MADGGDRELAGEVKIEPKASSGSAAGPSCVKPPLPFFPFVCMEYAAPSLRPLPLCWLHWVLHVNHELIVINCTFAIIR